MNPTNISLPVFNDYRLNKILIDLIIEISDDNNNFFEIDAHKIILQPLSKLFSLKDGLETIKSKVPDANAAYDLILLFYGQESNIGSYTKWQHELALLKCRKCWSLEITIPTIPFDLKVEAIDYDYFIEFCQILKIECANIAAQNIPPNYDLDRFPKDFVQQMIDTQTFPIAVIDHFQIKNILSAEVIMDNIGCFENVVVSPNGLYIAVISREKVAIYDGHKKLQHTIQYPYLSNFSTEPFSAKFTSDNKFFTVVYNKRYFVTYDLVNSKIVYNVDTNDLEYEISSLMYSPNGSYLVTIHMGYITIWSQNKRLCTILSIYIFENKIEFSSESTHLFIYKGYTSNILEMVIYDLSTFKKLKFPKKIIKASFQDTKYVVTLKDSKEIEVWDIDSNKLINTFDSMIFYQNYSFDCKITYIKFSPDNRYIITRNHNNYNIWNVITGMLYLTFNCNEIVISPKMKYIITLDCKEVTIYRFDRTLYYKIPRRHQWSFDNLAFISDRYFTSGTDSKMIFDIENPQGVKFLDNIKQDEYGLLGSIMYTKIGLKLLKYLNHS